MLLGLAPYNSPVKAKIRPFFLLAIPFAIWILLDAWFVPDQVYDRVKEAWGIHWMNHAAPTLPGSLDYDERRMDQLFREAYPHIFDSPWPEFWHRTAKVATVYAAAATFLALVRGHHSPAAN